MDKNYYVQILFKNGTRLDSHTNTDITNVIPISINGTEIVITEEEYCINLLQVEEMNIHELT